VNLNNSLSFLSSVIMFVFTVFVFERWTRRRTPYLLLWGTGLAMFGIGSFTEAFLALTWNSLMFRLWYVCGAMLNAGWLGQGTVYLLGRRKWANVLMVIIGILSLIGIVGVFLTPLDSSRFSTSVLLSEQYRNILPPGAPVRLLTPIFNIYGLVTLVGGALYSAWLFWRKRVLPNRVLGNVLIAVGALAIASTSTLTRLGMGSYLYLGELVAAILMFSGFLLATAARPESHPVSVEAHQPG
jgi:hypothetical protein